MTRLFLSLLLILSTNPGFSACVDIILKSNFPQATFGPEFEFRSWALVAEIPGLVLGYSKTKMLDSKTPASVAAQQDFATEVFMNCRKRGDCTILSENGAIVVRYTDGWWFQISLDPGVVEVQAKPATLDEYLHMENRIQEDIFDAAKRAGLKPPSFGNITSGGHINIGAMNTFAENSLLLRNFIVDFANHSELASGILLYDNYNAPAFNRKKDLRMKLSEVLAEYDRSLSQGEQWSTDRLVEEIDNRVYGLLFGSKKYVALSLKEMLHPNPEARRIEIRSLRAQKNMKDYLKLIKLFQERINYLGTVKEPIPYLNTDPIRDPYLAVENFYRYVTESKLAYSDYVSFLPLIYQKYRPDKNDGVVPRPNPVERVWDRVGQEVFFSYP